MKTKIAMILLPLMFGLVFASTAKAEEKPGSQEDIHKHLQIAASYEQKATEQNAEVELHQKMKKDYEARHYMLRKVGPPNDVLEMNKHCNALIQAAEALRSEYLEFAKWHRMRAAELQGR
jgi:hypothetical protein